MHKLGILLTLFLLLVGCSQNEQYFYHHPKKMRSMLMRCNAMEPNEARRDIDCLMAIQAFQQLVKIGDAQSLVDGHPEQFGQSIMKDQALLTQLKQGLFPQDANQNPVKRDQLKKQYHQVKQRLDAKTKLVLITEGM